MILTLKELKEAQHNYLHNGGDKIRFTIYKEQEGEEVYKYQDKEGNEYLIINGVNVLESVDCCGSYYKGYGIFLYWEDALEEPKKGQFNFIDSTFELDI